MIKVKLGDVADVKLSNVDKKIKSNEKIIRLCNYTDVYKNWYIKKHMIDSFMVATCNENEYEKFKLRKGQVAITKDSETPDDIGVPVYIAEDFDNVVLGYHLALITPISNKLNGSFLNYYFHTKQIQEYFTNNAGGSGQRYSLSIDLIKDVPLFLPDIETQSAIASILSSLDDKIELNNKINKELEDMAKTIYDYWFVQFDFPDENGKPYKSSGGEMVYNDVLKRKIPKGWEGGRLKKTKLCSIVRTGINRFVGEKVYLATANVNQSEIVNHEVKITYLDRPQRASMQPVLNSVWFAKMKSTIKHLLVNNTSKSIIESYILSTGFCGLKCSLNSLYYVWNYIKGDYFESKKNIVASGATQQAINDEDLSGFIILVPPSDLLQKFNNLVSSNYEKINSYKEQNTSLSHLRDFLLPLLMNGQVSVGEAKEYISNIINEPPVKVSDSKYQEWKDSSGIAARGDLDEETLIAIYEAIKDE